jgi:molybdate transport system substrate-binding protein
MTLKLFSARAVQEVLKPLIADFTAETGVAVDAKFGPVGKVREWLAAGEVADVIILSSEAMDVIAKEGAIVGDTRADLAQASIGVAIRQGAPRPDIGTGDALRATLLAAKAIATSDVNVGGTAGTHVRAVLARMGIADEVAHKIVPASGGNDVAAKVAAGEADIGMTFISEILPIKGAAVAGPLPPPYANVTTYAVAISASSGQADLARRLIARFTDAALRPRWEEAGLELPAARKS